MNDANSARWFSYDARHENDFEDESVFSCFMGKLFHYWQGRNAWWGTWSEIYPAEDSFCLDLVETKQRVERKRTQGTQWTIAELPVLVLAGQDDALIVGEINTDSPFSEIRTPTKLDLSLDTLGKVFQPNKQNSIYRFFGESNVIKPAQMPFNRHRSISFGSSYMLGWNTSKDDVDLEPLLKIVTRICKRMQKQ